MKKFGLWCKTHIWQTIVIGIAIVGVAATAITLPIVLSNNNNVTLTGISISGDATIKVGEKKTLTALSIPEGMTFENDIVWSITNGSDYIKLATNTGTSVEITGIHVGNTTIQVQCGSYVNTLNIEVTL